MPSEQEIEQEKTEAGGWARDTLDQAARAVAAAQSMEARAYQGAQNGVRKMKIALIIFMAFQVAIYSMLAFVAWDPAWLFAAGEWGPDDRAVFLFLWVILSGISAAVSVVFAELFQ